MNSKAFEAGDQVRLVKNEFGREPGKLSGITGIVRSIDKNRRRTAPYYIYYIEFPGEETLIDFEYRELELVPPTGTEFEAMD
ncbi:MAG TPA: hypothetical protein VGN34_04770 [Ktedonobacteraceae bacterium]|jgi:hypothetical protein